MIPEYMCVRKSTSGSLSVSVSNMSVTVRPSSAEEHQKDRPMHVKAEACQVCRSYCMYVQCKENAGFLNQQNEATLTGFSAETHWNHQVIKRFRWNECDCCTKYDPSTILNLIKCSLCYHEKPTCKKHTI